MRIFLKKLKCDNLKKTLSFKTVETRSRSKRDLKWTGHITWSESWVSIVSLMEERHWLKQRLDIGVCSVLAVVWHWRLFFLVIELARAMAPVGRYVQHWHPVKNTAVSQKHATDLTYFPISLGQKRISFLNCIPSPRCKILPPIILEPTHYPQ